MLFKAYPEEQRDLRWVTVALTTLAVILLSLRLTTTWKTRGTFGIEDGWIIFATVSLIVFASMIHTSTHYGFGTHVADIKKNGGNLKLALKYFWMTQHFYMLTNGCNKMAFLSLYVRVFPLKNFKRICTVLMVASVCRTIALVMTGIFQCTPINRVWERQLPGTCINTVAQRWTNAATNLTTDLLIFFLPLPLIMRLNMSIGNRIGLIFLFSIGFFICIITMLRMATLPQSLKNKEPTWESAPTNLWSFIEAASGVICACLICLRRTITQFWPQRWRSNKGSSGGYYGGAYNRRGSGPLSGRNHRQKQMSTFQMQSLKSSDLEVGKAEDNVTMVSRSESQERMIEGITVTKDIHITTTAEKQNGNK